MPVGGVAPARLHRQRPYVVPPIVAERVATLSPAGTRKIVDPGADEVELRTGVRERREPVVRVDRAHGEHPVW